MKIQPIDYEVKIPIFLYNVYVNTEKWNDSVINLNLFSEREKAIEVIKGWMNRGGSALGYFNTDYSLFIITKNDETEKFIRSKVKAKEKPEESK